MFTHEGPARTVKSNAILASYLALVAGFANAAGLILLGTFTSHVTGNVGRASISLRQADGPTAAQASLLVLLFLCGAITASLLVESTRLRKSSSGYAAALLVEGVGLSLLALSHGSAGTLSWCMGMQNSLVTRLSGSVVRTTHLTGVVTDLGIEIARWLRWIGSRLRRGPASAAGGAPIERPTAARSFLWLTIILAFATGGVLGTGAATAWGARSFAFPGAAALAAALYAFATGPRRKAV